MKKIMGGALALLMVGCASDNNGGEQYRYTPPVAPLIKSGRSQPTTPSIVSKSI